MNHRSRFTIFIFAIGLLSVETFGQSQRPLPPPKFVQSVQEVPEGFFGRISGGVYSNDYFGLRIDVPKSYVVLNRAEIDVLGQATIDNANRKGNAKLLEDALTKQVPLLAVAIKPVGSPSNAVFEIHARRQTGNVTANMVLLESVKAITAPGTGRLKRMLKPAKIGPRVFVGAELEVEYGGQKIDQEMLVGVMRGYALLIGITYVEETGYREIRIVVDGMRFDSK